MKSAVLADFPVQYAFPIGTNRMALKMIASNPGEREKPSASPMVIAVELHKDVCVLRCRGRFDAGSGAGYIQDRLEAIRQTESRRVIADFSEVSSVGSLGLTFIVNAYTMVVREHSGRFLVAGVRPFVEHVLEKTRLNTVIPLVADLTAGIRALQEDTMASGVGRARS